MSKVTNRQLEIEIKHKNLRSDFNGFNFNELRKKYNFTRNYVRKIVDTDEWKIRRKTIFDDIRDNFDGSNLDEIYKKYNLSDEQIESIIFNDRSFKVKCNRWSTRNNIIKEYNKNKCTCRELARKCGVSEYCVSETMKYYRRKLKLVVK